MSDRPLAMVDLARPSSRYETLDCWRAVAALGVLVYHRYGDDSALGPTWLGVQLFFVISGYCIGAALQRAADSGMSWWTFTRRRLRRIGPPYLASVLLAIAGTAVHFGLQTLDRPAALYVQNATMTQWLTVARPYLAGEREPTLVPWANGSLLCAPHWSLNYEEQFYVIAGLALAVSALVRPARFLAAVTALVAFVNWARPEHVTGFFSDYWLQFACGLLIHRRLTGASRDLARFLDLVLVLAVLFFATKAHYKGELHFSNLHYGYFGQLAVTTSFALALVALRPLDALVARAAFARPLFALGRMSYSLYLVQYPVLDVFSCALPPGGVLREALVFGTVLAASVAFFFAFERPFLNDRSPPPEAAAPRPPS